jgi:hypothetical protein
MPRNQRATPRAARVTVRIGRPLQGGAMKHWPNVRAGMMCAVATLWGEAISARTEPLAGVATLGQRFVDLLTFRAYRRTRLGRAGNRERRTAQGHYLRAQYGAFRDLRLAHVVEHLGCVVASGVGPLGASVDVWQRLSRRAHGSIMPHDGVPVGASPLDDWVITAFQFTVRKILTPQTVSEPVDVLNFHRAAVISDEHSDPGQRYREHHERQRKPPGLIKHASEQQAWDAGRHQDRVLAPPSGILLGVGGLRRGDEYGIVTTTTAMVLPIPRPLTSRFDAPRPPYFFAFAATFTCCLYSRTLASESASVTSATDR